MEAFLVTLGFSTTRAREYADAIQATERAELCDWIRTTTDIHGYRSDIILNKMVYGEYHSGASFFDSLRIAQFAFKHGYEALAADAIHWNKVSPDKIPALHRAVFDLARKRQGNETPQTLVYDQHIRSCLGDDWRTAELSDEAIANAAAIALGWVRVYNSSFR